MQEICEASDETRRAVRALYALDGARVEASLQLLRDWLQKQDHLPMKDFSDNFLESIIIASKGSLERAKERIDKYCTVRSLLPNFFEEINARNDFKEFHCKMEAVACPKLTEDYKRIIISRVKGCAKDSEQLKHFYKYGVICAEYLRENDCSDGIIAINDFREVNLAVLLPRINMIELGQAITVQEIYALRMKHIHVLSNSKMVYNLVNIVKQVFNKKMGERILVHQNLESLHKYVDKDLLPSTYGGKEKSVTELHMDWVELLSSEKHLAHLRRMKEARSAEHLRPVAHFNHHYMGMPGSFRALTVD